MTAQQKADSLIEYFCGLEYEGFGNRDFGLVEDFRRFIADNMEALQRLQPLSDPWRSAYMRLYDLKKAIEEY